MQSKRSRGVPFCGLSQEIETKMGRRDLTGTYGSRPREPMLGPGQDFVRNHMKSASAAKRATEQSYAVPPHTEEATSPQDTLYPKRHPEAIALSVVIPVFNEVESLEPLLDAVRSALGSALQWELLLVDDGSNDGSLALMQSLAGAEPRLRVVKLDRNHGQTAALAAGFEFARGSAVATLDADLQNDPSDLIEMLRVLHSEGVDAVVGYRATRKDNVIRRLSSRIANAVRRSLTGDQVRDTGCSTKVFRRAALLDLQLFNGMHRFLPTLLTMHGYRILEIPVSHHERRYGESKYGIRNRALRAFADLLAVRWMQRRTLRHRAEEWTAARGLQSRRAQMEDATDSGHERLSAADPSQVEQPKEEPLRSARLSSTTVESTEGNRQ